MNKLLHFALFTLIMSTTAFASGSTDFDDAINDVFCYAANYFTFEGTFTSNSSNAKTITLSKVTRNDVAYGNGDAFSLEIPGSKIIRRDDTDITYTITLTNGATEDNHLFNFSNDRYPVILTFFEDLVVPANCKYLFYGCRGLVDFCLYDVDTSNVTDMSHMFEGCQRSISGLSSFDTSNVTDMSYMFADYGCPILDLSSFNTRNVTNMSYMFAGCDCSILGLSSFNTGNVTNMHSMFNGCSSLIELDITNFNTSNVTDMNSMFVGCTGLKVLKVKSDFPGNPDMANEAMENMFEGRTVDHGKLIIFSDDTGFNPRFKNFVENYKDTVTLLHLVLKVDANKMLTFGQDADVSFGDGCGILFEDKSVLVNATDIKCPTEAGQMAYLVLADREISSTIENLLMIKHDKDFNEDTEHVYRVMPRGKISGNYKMITCDGDDTHNIAIVNSNEIYLEGLAGFTNADTVFFVVKKNGESIDDPIDDQNTVVIKNESDESAKIVANISNGSSDSNYKSTRLSLQGKLEFSGDNSGFVNAEVIASGANVEFAGANSMFNAPLRLRDNSVAEISESIDHDKDITVHKGSKLLIKKRSTLSGGSLFLFPY